MGEDSRIRRFFVPPSSDAIAAGERPPFWAPLVVALAIATVLLVPAWNRSINLSDEGLVWDGAAKVAAGTYDPAVFGHYSTRYFLESLAFHDPSSAVATLRFAWTLERIATAVIAGLIVFRFAGGLAMALTILAFALIPGPMHKAMIPLSIAVTLALLVWRRPNWRMVHGITLGIATAAITGLHPYTGVPLAVAALVLQLTERKDKFCGLCPILLVVFYFGTLPLLAPWVLHLDLSSFFARHAALVSSDFLAPRDLIVALFTGLRTPGIQGVAEAAFIDAGVIVIAVAIRFLKADSKSDPDLRRVVYLLLVVGLAGVPKMLARADGAHFLQNHLPFTMLAIVLFLTRVHPGKPLFRQSQGRIAFVAFTATAFVVIVFGVQQSYYVGGIFQAAPSWKRLPADIAPLRDEEPRVEDITEVVELVRTGSKSGDAIFCAPFCPGLYHLSRRENPLPLSLFDRPEDLWTYTEDDALADLQKAAPKVVVLEDFVADGKPANEFRRVAPRIFAWIGDNYRRVDQVGAFTVFEPR
ncbi:MAG: hypothetical protein H6684_02340 [Deltaproteobacteria bacterium]|nr:hypothetical protein [Deltaproteobacteria bacterium]